MGQFKKAGVPLTGMLTIHKGLTVVVDYFGDPGHDVRDDFVAMVGITASIKEVKSPMPKVIRRFEIGAMIVGASTLIANPPDISVSIVVDLSDQQKFVEDLAAAGGTVAKQAGVPLSVMLGVACVESGFGKGAHASKNLFGITRKAGQDWYPSCAKTTSGDTVAIAGQGTTGDSFCVAGSLENNAKIFCEFIKGHPRGGALVYKAGPWSPEELAQFPTVLHDAMNFGMGKSVDEYRTAVMTVIREQKLTRFDP